MTAAGVSSVTIDVVRATQHYVGSIESMGAFTVLHSGRTGCLCTDQGAWRSVRGSHSSADAAARLRPSQELLAASARRRRRCTKYSRNLAVCAAHSDALHSLITTLRGADGALPSLRGKVAIVTGAGRGLGKVVARELALAGAHVFVAGRHGDSCHRAIDEIRKDVQRKGGGEVEYLQLDLANLRLVEQAASDFKRHGLPLDILVNNAAAIVPTDGISVDGIETTMATNHFGPFLFTHRLIEPLQAAGSARVVYVYSLAELSAKLDFNNLTGDGCRSDLAMYASSKVAILLQVQEMQRRFGGSGVDFFAAQPGLTRSTLVLQLDWTKAAAALLGFAAVVIGQFDWIGAKPIVAAAASPSMEGKGGNMRYCVGPLYFGLFWPLLGPGWAQPTNLFSTAFFPPNNRLTRDPGAAALLYERTCAILNRVHGDKLVDSVGIPQRIPERDHQPARSEPVLATSSAAGRR